MRVLYLGRADEFSDTSSLALVPKQVFQRALALDERLHITWVAPGSASDEVLYEYLKADMPDPARLDFVKTSARKLGRMIGYFMTNEIWDLFHPTKTAIPYDVVLNQHFGNTPMLATLLTNKYKGGRFDVHLPIVNWHVWTLVRKQLETMPEYYAGEQDLMAETMSALFGRNVWESQFLYDEHVKTLQEFLRPAHVKRIKDRSEVVPAGIAMGALDEVRAARERRAAEGGQATLFWGGRLSGVKRVRVTFPLMAEVQKYTGAPVVISTSDGEGDVDWVHEGWPDWQVHTGVGKRGFWTLIGAGDVFLCNGVSEGYGTAWLEMLAAGQMGVFHRKWWVTALLPDWYPFIADSTAEQVQMAVALVKQWPDGPLWREYGPRVRDWLYAEHDEVRSSERIVEILHEEKARALAADARLGTGSVGQLANEAMESLWQGEPVAERDVYARMQAISGRREFGGNGDVLSRMYLRRCLEAAGWEDLCRSAEVEFVRSAR